MLNWVTTVSSIMSAFLVQIALLPSFSLPTIILICSLMDFNHFEMTWRSCYIINRIFISKINPKYMVSNGWHHPQHLKCSKYNVQYIINQWFYVRSICKCVCDLFLRRHIGFYCGFNDKTAISVSYSLGWILQLMPTLQLQLYYRFCLTNMISKRCFMYVIFALVFGDYFASVVYDYILRNCTCDN